MAIIDSECRQFWAGEVVERNCRQEIDIDPVKQQAEQEQINSHRVWRPTHWDRMDEAQQAKWLKANRNQPNPSSYVQHALSAMESPHRETVTVSAMAIAGNTAASYQLARTIQDAANRLMIPRHRPSTQGCPGCPKCQAR